MPWDFATSGLAWGHELAMAASWGDEEEQVPPGECKSQDEPASWHLKQQSRIHRGHGRGSLIGGFRRMGGLCCCCPRPGEFEDYSLHSRDDDHHCFCPRCCMRCFFRIHAAICGRMQGSDSSSSVQNVSSSALLPLEASPDACHAPAVGTRYHRAHTDASNSRIEEKIGISHSQLTNSDNSSSASGDSQGDEEGNERQAKAFRSSDSEPVTSISDQALDDDVCPTCLEEYVQENPKIIAQCGHHFHLGCIYDWLERSSQCPICDKEMVFNENS